MEAKRAPDETSIGENIKRERIRLGLTGDDVRRLAGIDPTSLSFFERSIREPRIRHLKKLAEAFRVPLSRLLRPARLVRSAPRNGARRPSRPASQ